MTAVRNSLKRASLFKLILMVEKMIDNFILVVGAMKCGTTSIFSYLSQHPQISACIAKEPNFFSHDSNWSKNFEWYQKLWQWEPDKHKIALEASANYTRLCQFPYVTERINEIRDKYKVNFKFIYIMRNPIERIESAYTHAYAMRWSVASKPLNEGVDQRLIEDSKYAQQIGEYYQKFHHDSILLLNLEDLKTSPTTLLKKICTFLDIDDSFQFEGLHEIHNSNTERSVNDHLWSLLSKSALLQHVAQVIPTQGKKWVYNSFFGHKIDRNFKLSLEQKKLIIFELTDDLKKLHSDYKVDLSRWGMDIL